MNRKKILFVQHAGAGGALVSLSQILTKLDPQDYETTVLLLSRDAKAIAILESAGSRVLIADRMSQDRRVIGGWHTLRPLHLYFRLRSLVFGKASTNRFRSILDATRPDLVYLNSLTLHRYAHVTHELDIPVVLHVREIVHGNYRARYAQIVEDHVSLTIYIGPYERRKLGARGRNEIIQNYVDLDKWNIDEVRSKTCPPTILFVGGLNEIKGVQVLLPALARLKRSSVPFKAVLLGLEEEKIRKRNLFTKLLFSRGRPITFRQAQRFVHENRLDNHCEFKPFVIDPVPEYAKADIVVFPSTEPHFARPLVEAGAMGLPVVASDLPGPRDVVQRGANGLLVSPNDPRALADALYQLIASPELCRAMGKANYEIVKSNFNADVNERRIIALIASLAGAASS